MILGWIDNKMKRWFSGRKTGKPIRSPFSRSGGAPPAGAVGSFPKRDIPRLAESIQPPAGAGGFLQRGKGIASFHSVLNLLCSCLCNFTAAAVGMTLLSVIFTATAAPVWAGIADNTPIINTAHISFIYNSTTITADGTVTVIAKSGQAGFAKYVRNVTTSAAGTGAVYSYNSMNYYTSGVTAKPGEILEYLLVSTNTSGTLSEAVVTDVLPTGYVSLKTGGYTGGSDITYVNEVGAASYLTAAASDDAATYATPILTVNVGAGATSSAGGTISTGKRVLVLYQVNVNNLVPGDKIVNSARLSSADITPSTASVTVAANIGLANFAKYVRNVTVPGGSGTPYAWCGNNYYLTGITAKPGDILEYIIVSTNIGSGTISDAVVTDRSADRLRFPEDGGIFRRDRHYLCQRSRRCIVSDRGR